LGQKFFGSEMSSIATSFAFITALLLSVLGAHVFHVVFEKPSLWLCQLLKHRLLGEVLKLRRLKFPANRRFPYMWRSDP
jgi:peptidoglycan/LPS O-acetylase OafA/YrhL